MTLVKSILKNNSSKVQVTKFLYGCVLLLSSLAYEISFQVAYFTIPFATLCFPCVFLLAAILSDKLGLKHCLKFMVICSVINFGFLTLFSNYMQWSLNEFWVDNSLTENEIYSLLCIGFHLSLGISVGLVELWKYLGYQSNFLIISLSAALANFVDLLFIWPTLYAFMDDGYLVTWKLLTLATFKISFLILCLPIGWLLVRSNASKASY